MNDFVEFQQGQDLKIVEDAKKDLGIKCIWHNDFRNSAVTWLLETRRAPYIDGLCRCDECVERLVKREKEDWVTCESCGAELEY